MRWYTLSIKISIRGDWWVWEPCKPKTKRFALWLLGWVSICCNMLAMVLRQNGHFGEDHMIREECWWKAMSEDRIQQHDMQSLREESEGLAVGGKNELRVTQGAWKEISVRHMHGPSLCFLTTSGMREGSRGCRVQIKGWFPLIDWQSV